jgi:hypothetical protein
MTMTSMYARRITRNLAGAVGAGDLAAALLSAANGSMPSAHATMAGRIITVPCLACTVLRPTVSVDGFDFNAGTMAVSGSRFTPGDPLHVELIAGDAWDSGVMLAQGDTTASLELTLPLGNGQYAHIDGGQFSINLSPSPDSPILCQGVYVASVQVTDTATGARASSASLDISQWWNTFARTYDPAGCPTPQPADSSGSGTSGMPIAVSTPVGN